MRHWHRHFLGRTQLPPTLSALAISEFFTLDGGEIRAVLSRYGMDMRLGSVLQIGFLKMCGRPLDKLQRMYGEADFVELAFSRCNVGRAV
jgi:hypothetical protein